MDQADTAPLETAVAAWAAAWRNASAGQVAALWDRADSSAWFLTSDGVEPFVGAAVIGAIQRRCVSSHRIDYDVSGLHLRRLGGDLGLAFFEARWRERGNERAVPLGRRVRVTLLLRRRPEGWRVFHYAEAPLAPLLELQAFYEQVAAEGFAAMPNRAGDRVPSS
jgi:ketosteroid isomerase-like protein